MSFSLSHRPEGAPGGRFEPESAKSRVRSRKAKEARTTGWTVTRPDVKSWKTGKEFDIRHGDFEDIDEQIVQTGGEPACQPAFDHHCLIDKSYVIAYDQ